MREGTGDSSQLIPLPEFRESGCACVRCISLCAFLALDFFSLWILYNTFVSTMRMCVSCKRFLAPENIDEHLSCRRCRTCSRTATCAVCSGWDSQRWQEFETHCKSVDKRRMKKVRSTQGAPAPSVVVSGAGPGKTSLGSLGRQELSAPAGVF